MKSNLLTILMLQCISGALSTPQSNRVPGVPDAYQRKGSAPSKCALASTVTTTVYSTVIVTASADAAGDDDESCDHSPTSNVQQSLTVTSSPAEESSTYVPSPPVKRGLRNMLYFGKWTIYQMGLKPQNIPTEDITHLLYAFGDIAPDGSVVSDDSYADTDIRFDGDRHDGSGNDVYGNIKQIFLHKTRNRRLKTLLSIGGWTYSQSGKFAAAGATPASRQRFASSAVKILADWGFDGIDIDWEYPTSKAEAANYMELLRACRVALDEYARSRGQEYHYLLTVASPAGSQHYSLQDLAELNSLVDSIHLMAYDYSGSWDTTAGHLANLYADSFNPETTKFNTDRAVSDYIAAGVTPDKLVLGIPLYGRSFAGTDGLGTPFSGVGTGTVEQGVWLYRDLPRPNAAVSVERKVGAAYSYDSNARELVSYDNVETAEIKAEFIRDKQLGGAVFWEAAGDKKGEESLVRVLANGMGYDVLDDSQNMLDYPDSRYDNIRNKMQSNGGY